MWTLARQQHIANMRDALTLELRKTWQSRGSVDHDGRLIEAAALRAGLSYPDQSRYRVRQLLLRTARPVEVVNAVVAVHFQVSTNDVQFARRDARGRYGSLTDFLFG